MILQEMIHVATDQFKQKMLAFGEKMDLSELTPQLAEEMGKCLKQASQSACLASYQGFLQSYQVHKATIEHQGKTLRKKLVREKEFLTLWGKMAIERNLYQADRGGACYAPLDAKWGMEGEYATMDVREIILYAAAQFTPVEAHEFFRKCGLFNASPTAMYNIIAETGELVAEQGDTINQSIRQAESLPADTSIMVASLDGANVLLREPGTTGRRPAERPSKKDADKETSSSYKNVMVGSVSFYGEAKPGQHCSERLRSVYAARMPEDRAATLKQVWERELAAAQEKLPDDVTKILIMDGARGLWNYLEGHDRFTDYESILDFYHTTEHLSKTAELLFGKQSSQAQRWYDTYYQKLLEEDAGPQAIIRSIDYYRTTGKLSQSASKELKRERGFFVRNKRRMRYAEFRKRKWPIGSGPIEAACKTIVKQRLCRSGMRWSCQGGQNVLWLRTYLKSGRWELFWEQYKKLKSGLQYAA